MKMINQPMDLNGGNNPDQFWREAAGIHSLTSTGHMSVPSSKTSMPHLAQFPSPVLYQFSNSNPNPTSPTSATTNCNYARNLNFSTVNVAEDAEYNFPKKKTVRDPLSHRIIEKRRRDRMNNCLADLARLLPPSSLRKGRGRIEKTEIVELAIKHLRHLQNHVCPHSETREFNEIGRASNSKASSSSASSTSGIQSSFEDGFRIGFQEAFNETFSYLIEKEGLFPGVGLCIRLFNHLYNHFESHPMSNNEKLSADTFAKIREITDDMFKQNGSGFSGSGDSICSGYQPNGSSSGSDANGPGGSNGEIVDGSRHMDCNRSDSYEGDDKKGSEAYSKTLTFDSSETRNDTNQKKEIKPPLPVIIGSSTGDTSGSSNTLSSPNGRSSDESSSFSTTSRRYKYKNNIKQRFNADMQTKKDRFHHHGRNLGYNARSTKGSTKCRKGTVNSSNEPSSISTYPSSNVEAMKNVKEESPEELSNGAFDEDNRHCSSRNLLIDARDLRGSQTHGSTGVAPQSPTKEGIGETENVKKEAEDFPGKNGTRKADHKESQTQTGEGGDCQSDSWFMIPTSSSKQPTGKGVPAFALHDKGLFYVPLTIDKSIVSPFTDAIDPSREPPLYPVTISVCFLVSTPTGEKKILNPGSDLNVAPLSLPVPLSVDPVNKAFEPAVSNRQVPLNSFIMGRFTESQIFQPALYSSDSLSTSVTSVSSPSSHKKLKTIPAIEPYPTPSTNLSLPAIVPVTINCQNSPSHSSYRSLNVSEPLGLGKRHYSLISNSSQEGPTQGFDLGMYSPLDCKRFISSSSGVGSLDSSMTRATSDSSIFEETSKENGCSSSDNSSSLWPRECSSESLNETSRSVSKKRHNDYSGHKTSSRSQKKEGQRKNISYEND